MTDETMGQEENEELPETPQEPQETETLKNEEVADEPKTLEPEKAEKSKEIKSLLVQKEHWRKKALEAEAKIKVEKPKAPVGSEDEWRHKVEFLLENRDVSEEEFDHLAAVALRRSGSISIDALKDAQEREKDYISYRRKKIEDKNKIPGSTSVGYVGISQKISEDMKPEEVEKVLRARFERTQNKETGI